MCKRKKRQYLEKKNLELKNDLLAHPTRYPFHISCRKSFCSKNNIINANRNTSEVSCSFQKPKDQFNIKKNCLICGKSGTIKKKPLISICTGTGSKTRRKIFDAATLRKDDEMQGRLQFYENLFAADAKYHKFCYSKYVSRRNIKSVLNKQATVSVLKEKEVAEEEQEKEKMNESDGPENTSEFSTSEERESTENLLTGENDLLVLHKAAAILKKSIAEQIKYNSNNKSS